MSENVELIFETPPPPSRGQSRYTPWLNELRNHPGSWAKWPEKVGDHTAKFIKDGPNGFDPGEFEAVHRYSDGDRTTAWLFVRYVGASK